MSIFCYVYMYNKRTTMIKRIKELKVIGSYTFNWKIGECHGLSKTYAALEAY